MLVKITAIKRTDRVSKTSGKPFISVGIKTDKHGDAWLSGFGNKGNEGWVVGKEVEIEVEQKGEYLNFSTAKAVASQGDARLINLVEFKILPLLENMAEEIHALHKKAIMSELDEHDGSDPIPPGTSSEPW